MNIVLSAKIKKVQWKARNFLIFFIEMFNDEYDEHFFLVYMFYEKKYSLTSELSKTLTKVDEIYCEPVINNNLLNMYYRDIWTSY